MPGYLGNFPNAWVSGKFPRYPGIWEASQIPLKCLGIWEIPQIPVYLGNSPNAWVSGKFPKS